MDSVLAAEICFLIILNVNLYIICDIGVIIPTAQKGKLKHREMKKWVQMPPQGWSVTLNPCVLSSIPVLMTKTSTTNSTPPTPSTLHPHTTPPPFFKFFNLVLGLYFQVSKNALNARKEMVMGELVSPRTLGIMVGIRLIRASLPFLFLATRDLVTLTGSECLLMGTVGWPLVKSSMAAIGKPDATSVGERSWVCNAGRGRGMPASYCLCLSYSESF